MPNWMEIKTVQPHTTLQFSVNQKRGGGTGGRREGGLGDIQYLCSQWGKKSVPVEMKEFLSRMKPTQNVKLSTV